MVGRRELPDAAEDPALLLGRVRVVLVDLDVPGAALGAAHPPHAALRTCPGDIVPGRDPAHRLFGEGAHRALRDATAVGMARDQGQPVSSRVVGDRIAGFLEVQRDRRAGPVGIDSSSAVGDHRIREPVEREPSDHVALVRLHDPRGAAPAADLEEDPDPRLTARRPVVHRDRRPHVRRPHDETSLLQRFAYHGVDDGLELHMPRQRVPQPARVHVAGPPGQQHFQTPISVTDGEQVHVHRHGVPPAAHALPPGR